MDERLGADVRTYFDGQFEPSPGLAERVLRRLDEKPAGRDVPRLMGLIAAALAVLVALPLGTLAITHHLTFPGAAGPESPALSMGALTPKGAWMIRRGPGRNILFSTTDGGRTWSQRLSFDGVYDGMSFSPDGSRGVLWTMDMAPARQSLTVYMTIDSGEHWVAQTPTTWPADDVYFDSLQGWVVSRGLTGRGTEATIWYTADGGTSWTAIGKLPAAAQTNGQVFGVGDAPLRFYEHRLGWYASRVAATAGHSGLFATWDEGKTWSEVSIVAPAGLDAYDMFPELPLSFGTQNILPVGFRAKGGADNATANLLYIYTSADGGRTWQSPHPMLDGPAAGFQPVGDRWQVFYLDAKHWWISSQSSTAGDMLQAAPAIARTSDGGLTWVVYKNAPRVLQLMFSDPEHGWAEDVTGEHNANGWLTTSDGGAHWNRVRIP